MLDVEDRYKGERPRQRNDSTARAWLDTTQDSMDAMPATKRLFGLSEPGGCAGAGACFNLSRAYVRTPDL